MSIEELEKRLDATKIPYTHLEFIDTKLEPAPDPPYISYIYSEDAVGPDFAPQMLKKIEIGIELYTSRIRDKELEKLIEERVLYDVEFHKEIAPVEGEDLVQTSYDIAFKVKG